MNRQTAIRSIPYAALGYELIVFCHHRPVTTIVLFSILLPANILATWVGEQRAHCFGPSRISLGHQHLIKASRDV